MGHSGDSADLMNLGVRCGGCRSENVMFVACPDHEWAIAFLCFDCLKAVPLDQDDGPPGQCPECGWKGEGDVGPS